MKKIKVRLEESEYPVISGSGVIDKLPEELIKAQLPKRIFVIIDSKVYRFYSKAIKKVFGSWTEKIHFLKITAGENSKTLSSAGKIYKFLMGENFGRDTLIITIGGGTIGDLGGFVASTYMRGVKLVHVPTTLLAAVDSAIGGKTGVNLLSAKNVIGTFYQPCLVLIDTDFFKTLPRDERISGIGEIIKYGFISSYELYTYIYSNFDSLLELKSSALNKIVLESVKFKSEVVSKDLFDTKGLRRILNFGHTFAHAFESYFQFSINHGKAVTAGIIAAMLLSYRKNIINIDILDELLHLPLKLKDKNLISDFDAGKIIELMKTDKKNKGGELNFVLLKNIGQILIDVKAQRSDIKYALEGTKEILV